MFNINPLYFADAYKVGHKAMLADNTTRLYGTWIPRSTKYAPNGITKIVSFGQQLVWRFIHDEFENNFFSKTKGESMSFVSDMSLMLGMYYDGSHFEALYDLGYLPIMVQSLPEGIETNPNTPHMTFINTVDGFAWLTLYLETIVSSLAWKPSTSATIAKRYKQVLREWMLKTCSDSMLLEPYMCHDFSARGLSPWDMISSGLGHATSFSGSDTLAVIPASRKFYDFSEHESPIASVAASEHSVSTTKIFTVGEKQMISDWLKTFPTGILSIVADTFDLWKLITEYVYDLKEEIISRDGKLVIRPDSGNPVDIICGKKDGSEVERKGVIELLWDIFGGTVNEQGYKVLDSHIGAIYGDSITIDRQIEIYQRLSKKGFAVCNIVLGVGSFSYQYNSRDTLGFAAKGAWFETLENGERKSFNIYKDPVTDDGTKKSLKGFQAVEQNVDGEYYTISEVSESDAYSKSNLLKVIYADGEFYNKTSLIEVREKINSILNSQTYARL